MLLWSRALGEFDTNCYIIACPETKQALIIDPGQPDPWIWETVQLEGLTVKEVILTHGHCDHIGGVEYVKSWCGAPVRIHNNDRPMLLDARLNGSAFFGEPFTAPAPDGSLKEGDEVTCGTLRFQVLFTPGHSPGSISLYTPGHVIAGDALFAGSIGRTDLPGGDAKTLLKAIKTKLLTLPKATIVYPGHGPETTIGDEAAYNPFLS
jgi:glyoxylase-like metal-dependent hydrolase (beta-lactamase superfamily II)